MSSCIFFTSLTSIMRLVSYIMVDYKWKENIFLIMLESYWWRKIAGRLSSNTQQTGEILINGRKETLAFGTSVRNTWKRKTFHAFVNLILAEMFSIVIYILPTNMVQEASNEIKLVCTWLYAVVIFWQIMQVRVIKWFYLSRPDFCASWRLISP